MNRVTVIGAGLAGSECAWQLAQRRIQVTLREMKPLKRTPAHVTDDFAELCCSNSLRGAGLENAVGLLKEELRRLDSLILRCADATAVPAGGALAVDRHGFSAMVTQANGKRQRERQQQAHNAADDTGLCVIGRRRRRGTALGRAFSFGIAALCGSSGGIFLGCIGHDLPHLMALSSSVSSPTAQQ